jgi:hypothetical protein
MTAELLETDYALPLLRDKSYEYSVLVDKGIQARQRKDTAKWRLGGYVRELETTYRDRTVEQYADDIGEAAKSLYEYAGMASFFSQEIRESLSELDLSYSHFREARRLKDLNKAIEFLKVAASNHWTVKDMWAALKALRQSGHTVAETYSDAPPPTDLNNHAIERNPLAVWRGVGTLKFDNKGRAQLHIEAPDLEPDKEYIVIIQEVTS